jgi:predicted nucleotidyltransferase
VKENKTIVQEIKEKLKNALPALKTRYPIEKMGIFGSVTRGDFTDNSDIDIMVEFNDDIDWKFFDLQEELEKLLERKVDLVAEGAMKSHYLPYVKKDLMYI